MLILKLRQIPKFLSRLPAILPVLLPLVILGCGSGPYLEDDEGGPRQDSSGLGSHPDNLSLPYAQGTKVRIAVRSGGSTNMSAWQLRSDNPAVLSVDKLNVDSGTSQSLSADCTAVGAGETTLHLLDDSGAERRQAAVSVGIPDRVRVLAHGALRLAEQTQSEALKAEVTEARILTGSQGVFALIYQRGEQRLYGRGLIKFDPVAQLEVKNQTITGALVNEWLFIKPMTDGDYSLALRAGGGSLLALPVHAVPETAIGSFSLLHQQASAPKNDQQLWVLLQARDMTGRDIQGVYGNWTLGGAAQIGSAGATQTTGDLYRYTFADGNAQALVATRGALNASMTITAAKGTIYDTTYLGCGFSGRPRRASALMLLVSLAALGGLLLRRRLGGGPAGT